MWVIKKLPQSEIEEGQLLPKQMGGLAIDVREGGEIKFLVCFFYIIYIYVVTNMSGRLVEL